MKNFSPRRFGQLLRLDLIYNKRRWLNLALGLFIANAICEYHSFALWTHTTDSYVLAQSVSIDRMREMYFLLTYAVILVGIASTCGIFKNKTHRIYWLTLPATNLEKLLSRLLLCTVGWLLMHFIIFAAIDMLRIALLAWQPNAPCSAIPYLWHDFIRFVDDWQQLFSMPRTNGMHGAWAALWSLVSSLSLFATYLLGSVIFRRYAFWKNTGIIIAAPILLFFPLVNWNPDTRSINVANSIIPVTTIIFAVLTVVFIWIAWRQFCRMPVTRKKLF